MKYAYSNGINYPTSKALWYYSLTLNQNRYMNAIYTIFLHLLPAFIVDTVGYCIGKKPK